MNREPLRPITEAKIECYDREGYMLPPFAEVTLKPGDPMDRHLPGGVAALRRRVMTEPVGRAKDERHNSFYSEQ